MVVDVSPQARKHDAELRAFRRRLFSESADSTAWVGSRGAAQMPQLQPLGPVKSVTDRHAVLTIVADTADLGVMLDDPEYPGTLMTLSVAAHHRQLHTRLPVDPDEAAAWVTEVLGEEWSQHVYAAGALSTTGNSARLTTQFFYVFVGKDGRPQVPPEKFELRVSPLRPQ